MKDSTIQINAGRVQITVSKPGDRYVKIHAKVQNPFTQKTKTHFAEIYEEDLASIIYALI